MSCRHLAFGAVLTFCMFAIRGNEVGGPNQTGHIITLSKIAFSSFSVMKSEM